MRILMGNNTLSLLAGSETYIFTLASELKRLGHEIMAYSPHLGIIAAKLEALGVKCVSELSGGESGQIRPFSPILEESEGGFDVAICAHYDITRTIRQKFPNIPIIAICHGIIHENQETGEIYPEHPVTDLRIEQYVAVSEEIQNILQEKYGIASTVIRNFFDLDRFKRQGKLPKKPGTILVSSNYWGVDDPINQIIREVADHYDAKFIGIGMNFVPTFETGEVIKEADIVFGMGRSVMEGFCAGKIAVVHGRWGTGGVLTPKSHDTLKLTNFSGRPVSGDGQLFSSSQIISQIDAAWNEETITGNMKIVSKDHDVKKAAQKFLEIAEKIIK